jgi:hypothetical protein
VSDLSQIATSAKDSIGRYFSMVSVLPSAMLVAWIVLLVGSGAWSGPPDTAAAFRAFGELGLGGTAGLVLASLAMGVVLHPVQFAFVQFLEGYWGVSRPAQRLRYVRIKHHWDRLDELREKSIRLSKQIHDLTSRKSQLRPAERAPLDRALIDLNAAHQELRRIAATAPPNDPGLMMPTRLGNALRYYETQVGKAYKIDTVTTVPYLSRAAAPGDMDYVNDQRSQLDLAVRTVIVAFAATGLSVVFLARHGLWLLVALVPYAAAYLAYRGAVVIAGEYGRALGVLVTLNRFELYDRLRLPFPSDTAEERARNTDVMGYLLHNEMKDAPLTYRPIPPEQVPSASGGPT